MPSWPDLFGAYGTATGNDLTQWTQTAGGLEQYHDIRYYQQQAAQQQQAFEKCEVKEKARVKKTDDAIATLHETPSDNSPLAWLDRRVDEMRVAL